MSVSSKSKKAIAGIRRLPATADPEESREEGEAAQRSHGARARGVAHVRGKPSQSRVGAPAGYTVHTNSTLPSSSTRLEISPRLAPAYIVERGSGEWSSPSACPSSWVTVF